MIWCTLKKVKTPSKQWFTKDNKRTIRNEWAPAISKLLSSKVALKAKLSLLLSFWNDPLKIHMVILFRHGLKHSLLCTAPQWFLTGGYFAPKETVLQSMVTRTCWMNVWPTHLRGVARSEGPRSRFNALRPPLTIAKNVIFELVFCTWSLSGQWSLCVNRRDTCRMCGCLSLESRSHRAFEMPPEYRIPVPSLSRSSARLKGGRFRVLHLWLGKQGQPQMATLSVWTRSCFESCRKKSMAF